MSHGPGAAMRLVVDRLAELDADCCAGRPDWHALSEIAGEGATKARTESMRRAVRTLKRDGVVQMSYRLSGYTGKLHVRLAAPYPRAMVAPRS